MSEPTEDSGSGGGSENQTQQTGPVETQPVEEVVRPYTVEFKPKVGMLISINNSKDLRYLGSAYYSSTDRANDTLKKYSDESDSFGDALDKRPATTEGSKIRDTLEIFGGTAWLPMIEDLPDLTASLGRTYKYAVLCDDWFNASKFKTDTYSDPVYGEDDMYIKEVTSETDNTEATVERSWDNRDPGEIKEGVKGEESGDSDSSSDSSNSSESGDGESSDDANTVEKNPGFYTETELEQFSPVLDPPSWLKGDSQYIPYNYFTSFFLKDGAYSNYTGKAGGTTTYAFDDLLYTPYIGNTWYYNTEVQKVRQDSFNPHNVVLGSATTDEMILRALEILGDDILLRDEYVISNVYNSYKDIFDIGNVHTYPDVDENASSKEAKFFGYFYSNTSVMDTHEPLVQPSNSSVYGNDSLVTNDYIIQCIYRAMGVNCLKTQVFFYADKEMDIDFTPIASELTVDVKNVNQIQNRVDVFNTRTNLDQYWAKAVSDGLIKETGVLTYNTLDAAYKPWAVKVGDDTEGAEDIVMKDPNDTSCNVKYPAGTWFELNPYGKDLSITEAGKRGHSSNVEVDGVDYKLIDYARTEHMTLAEFCIVLKKAMDIYGEEILTEKEQTLLLLNYGTSLPYELPEEELAAVKYLMAKGILDERMNWSQELQLDDMLIILARVADPATRLTFKEVTITYNQTLLDAGYYPADFAMTNEDDAVISVVGAVPTLGDQGTPVNGGYANAEYVDYFLRMQNDELTCDVVDSLTNVVLKDVTKTVSPYFKYNANSAVVSDLSSLYIAKRDSDNNYLSTSGPKDFSNLKVVGMKYLSDGFAYMHIRINADCIYMRDSSGQRNLSKYNEDYVLEHDGRKCLIINSSNAEFAPSYWMVGTEGGIYKYNEASFAVKNPGTPEGEDERSHDKYVFSWFTDYYGSGYAAELGETYIASSPETGVDISDIETMKKKGFYPTTILEIIEGKVTRAACPEITYVEKQEYDYDSFDEVSAGSLYVDRQRMLIGYASYLTANPYLEEDKVGALGIKNQVTQTFSNILKVKLATSDSQVEAATDTSKALMSNVYFGGEVVIYKEDPTNPAAPFTFHGYNESEHVAIYIIDSDIPLEDLNSQLYTENAGSNVEVASGYVATNDSLLVDTATLTSLMNMSCYNYSFNDFMISPLEKDDAGNVITLLLSFTLSHAGNASIPYNVYLYKGLNLVAVNNMITQVPSDEILFMPQDDGSYLINYRAVLGWQSGFSWNSTAKDHKLILSTEGRQLDDIYDCINAYSNIDEVIPIHHITDDKDNIMYRCIPLSVPYILSNYIVYTSINDGAYLFVVKNNDILSSNSVIDNVSAEVVEGSTDPYADTKDVYKDGASLLSKLLGIDVGAGDLTSNYLIASYNLTNTANINKSSSEEDKPDRRFITVSTEVLDEYDSENLGKVFFDESQRCWYYILPEITGSTVTKKNDAGNTFKISSFMDSNDVCRKVRSTLGITNDIYKSFATSYESTVRPAVVSYYDCTYPLPLFYVNESDYLDIRRFDQNTVMDISCNVYKGYDYGILPAFAYSSPASHTDDYGKWGLCPSAKNDGTISGINASALISPGGYLYTDRENSGLTKGGYAMPMLNGEHVDCPTGILHKVMGVSDVVCSSLFSDTTKIVVYTGNIRRRYNPSLEILVDYYGRGTADENTTMNVPNTTAFSFLNSSARQQNLAFSDFAISYTEDRDLLLDDNLRGSLEDRVQTPIVDWSEFTFNRLIHDVDNFASIFLIIVLNILPRICMFVFIIMIGLATIANVKPWRRFCTNVFDPYKFFTFGHATVLTIDTKLLLISSIIATATFALFMDGTLLHLISWFVQFVSAFITR